LQQPNGCCSNRIILAFADLSEAVALGCSYRACDYSQGLLPLRTFPGVRGGQRNSGLTDCEVKRPIDAAAECQLDVSGEYLVQRTSWLSLIEAPEGQVTTTVRLASCVRPRRQEITIMPQSTKIRSFHHDRAHVVREGLSVLGTFTLFVFVRCTSCAYWTRFVGW